MRTGSHAPVDGPRYIYGCRMSLIMIPTRVNAPKVRAPTAFHIQNSDGDAAEVD
jgi:hypothetical protein